MKTGFSNFYKPPTRSKRTVRTSTSLQHALLYSQNGLSELLKAFYTIKTDSLNPLTSFAVFKTGFPNLYKPPTCFAVVTTDSQNFYKPPTRLAVVKLSEHPQASNIFTLFKTVFPNVYKPPTRLAVVKTDSPNLSSVPLPLSVAYLQGQNGLSKLLQASYTLGVVETDFQDVHKPPTRLAVVKIDSPNTTKALYVSQYRLSEQAFRTSTSLLHGQNGLSKLLQAFYTVKTDFLNTLTRFAVFKTGVSAIWGPP